MSVNKVIIVGNLGSDPETRYMPGSGDPVCSLSIATSESWKDKNSGEKRVKTEWHRVVMFRGLAKIADEYLKKGATVYIEGRLQTRKWQQKDGQDRYTTEILADNMKMLGSKSNNSLQNKENNEVGSAQNSSAGNKEIPNEIDELEDDIPF